MKNASTIRTSPPARLPGRGGFTLTELLVIAGIIGLALAIVLPSVKAVFAASADAQARGMTSAMLGAARGAAIENQAPAGLHGQIGLDGKYWLAVMTSRLETRAGNINNGKVVLAPAAGYSPQQLPGDMALGELTGSWVFDTSSGTPAVATGHYNAITDGAAATDPSLANFTTLTVLFGADGSWLSQIPGYADASGNPDIIDTSVKAFDSTAGLAQIWATGASPTLDKPSARALTLFNYKTVKALGTGNYTTLGSRAYYLETNGQFLCVNPCSGQLITSK